MVFSDHRADYFSALLSSALGLFAHTDSSLVSSRQVCGLPKAAMVIRLHPLHIPITASLAGGPMSRILPTHTPRIVRRPDVKPR
jgi:hypothetical protein